MRFVVESSQFKKALSWVASSEMDAGSTEPVNLAVCRDEKGGGFLILKHREATFETCARLPLFSIDPEGIDGDQMVLPLDAQHARRLSSIMSAQGMTSVSHSGVTGDTPVLTQDSGLKNGLNLSAAHADGPIAAQKIWEIKADVIGRVNGSEFSRAAKSALSLVPNRGATSSMVVMEHTLSYENGALALNAVTAYIAGRAFIESFEADEDLDSGFLFHFAVPTLVFLTRMSPDDESVQLLHRPESGNRPEKLGFKSHINGMSLSVLFNAGMPGSFSARDRIIPTMEKHLAELKGFDVWTNEFLGALRAVSELSLEFVAGGVATTVMEYGGGTRVVVRDSSDSASMTIEGEGGGGVVEGKVFFDPKKMALATGFMRSDRARIRVLSSEFGGLILVSPLLEVEDEDGKIVIVESRSATISSVKRPA